MMTPKRTLIRWWARLADCSQAAAAAARASAAATATKSQRVRATHRVGLGLDKAWPMDDDNVDGSGLVPVLRRHRIRNRSSSESEMGRSSIYMENATLNSRWAKIQFKVLRVSGPDWLLDAVLECLGPGGLKEHDEGNIGRGPNSGSRRRKPHPQETKTMAMAEIDNINVIHLPDSHGWPIAPAPMRSTGMKTLSRFNELRRRFKFPSLTQLAVAVFAMLQLLVWYVMFFLLTRLVPRNLDDLYGCD